MADFDLAVIGAGAAGLAVTAVAAQLGLRVLLVERERMGGDCLNAGCVPSKALLAAAHAAAGARAAGRFGIRLSPPEIDWDAVSAHVAGAIAAIAPNDSEERFRALGATVLKAEARFVAPGAIMAEGRRITARRFVIAAGSRPLVPAIPGLDEVPFLTNFSLFGIPGPTLTPPGHLLILGGGPVGLEMAAAHAALGWEVSLVEAATIAAREDPELVAGLREALTETGVRLCEGVAVAAVEPGPALVLGDGTRIAGTHLLIAAGRRANLENLGLEAGNIRASRAGIETDRGLRSLSNRLVYAVGDIADPAGIGPRYFTHVGSYHAGIVIRRALFRMPARIDYRALPRVLYTEPELAQVGLTEDEARAAGRDVRVVRWKLAENDRAIAEAETRGMVKLVATRRGRLLGAGILSRAAGEMTGVFTLAIERRLKLSALAATIVPYPTRAEAGKRAAGLFYVRSLFSASTKRLVRFLAQLP